MKEKKSLPTLVSPAAQLLLPEQLAEQAANAVRELLAEAAAANTTRSYASAQRYWAGWHRARYGIELTLPTTEAVVMQFVVSIVLLVGTVVIYNQLTYIKHKNLGFERENLLYMPMSGDMWKKQGALRAELQRDAFTSQWAIISDLPTDLTSGTIDVVWPGKDPKPTADRA